MFIVTEANDKRGGEERRGEWLRELEAELETETPDVEGVATTIAVVVVLALLALLLSKTPRLVMLQQQSQGLLQYWT